MIQLSIETRFQTTICTNYIEHISFNRAIIKWENFGSISKCILIESHKFAVKTIHVVTTKRVATLGSIVISEKYWSTLARLGPHYYCNTSANTLNLTTTQPVG